MTLKLKSSLTPYLPVFNENNHSSLFFKFKNKKNKSFILSSLHISLFILCRAFPFYLMYSKISFLNEKFRLTIPNVLSSGFQSVLCRDSQGQWWGRWDLVWGQGWPLFPLEHFCLFPLYNLASDMILPDDSVPVLKIMYKNLDAIIICFSKVPIKWFKWSLLWCLEPSLCPDACILLWSLSFWCLGVSSHPSPLFFPKVLLHGDPHCLASVGSFSEVGTLVCELGPQSVHIPHVLYRRFVGSMPIEVCD